MLNYRLTHGPDICELYNLEASGATDQVSLTFALSITKYKISTLKTSVSFEMMMLPKVTHKSEKVCIIHLQK